MKRSRVRIRRTCLRALPPPPPSAPVAPADVFACSFSFCARSSSLPITLVDYYTPLRGIMGIIGPEGVLNNTHEPEGWGVIITFL